MWSWSYYIVVIMSYYNKTPIWTTEQGQGDQIEKWCKTNTKMAQADGKLAYQIEKMVQAIFLPGAWGKIPVFMGKNRPTPGAAMAFFML